MSSRFFYVQLKFTPKSGLTGLPMTKQHGAVVEVPKDLVQRKRSEIINENPSEKAIALDLARRAALGTFPTVEERVVGLYHEDATWCEEKPPVMNERPCDNEEIGTRAWRIAVLPRQFPKTYCPIRPIQHPSQFHLLSTSVREINKKTDLNIEIESLARSKHRRVTSVTFASTHNQYGNDDRDVRRHVPPDSRSHSLLPEQSSLKQRYPNPCRASPRNACRESPPCPPCKPPPPP